MLPKSIFGRSIWATMMYLKLREPKLNLILNGEVTQTSTFNEAFKPLQDFPSQEKPSSSENQA